MTWIDEEKAQKCLCVYTYVCVFISASLVGIPIGTTSSAIRSKICTITPGIKKHTSIIKKKKKKHDKIVYLAKESLSRIEVLISKSLIDSNISHEEFVLINNVLKEYKKIKEKIKYLKASSSLVFIKRCYSIVSSVE